MKPFTPQQNGAQKISLDGTVAEVELLEGAETALIDNSAGTTPVMYEFLGTPDDDESPSVPAGSVVLVALPAGGPGPYTMHVKRPAGSPLQFVKVICGDGVLHGATAIPGGVLNSLPVKTVSRGTGGRIEYVEVEHDGATYRLTWNRDANGNFLGHGAGWEVQP